MIIVAGHLKIATGSREDFLERSLDAIGAARTAPGCLDYSVSPDPVDVDRVNVCEIWRDADSLEAFRGSGMDNAQGLLVVAAAVGQFGVN